MPHVEGYEKRIVEVLRVAEMPLDIENVRKKAGIKNWQTAKALLFELLADGSVSAVKTSKSWIFWVETPAGRGCLELLSLLNHGKTCPDLGTAYEACE